MYVPEKSWIYGICLCRNWVYIYIYILTFSWTKSSQHFLAIICIRNQKNSSIILIIECICQYMSLMEWIHFIRSTRIGKVSLIFILDYEKILMARQSYGFDVKLQYTSNYVDLICILDSRCYWISRGKLLWWTVNVRSIWDHLSKCKDTTWHELAHSVCAVSVRCVCVCKRLWGVMIQAPAYL